MKQWKRFAALALILVLTVLCVACSAKQKIVGSWMNTKAVLGAEIKTGYTFREDGTGVQRTALGIDTDFTYALSEDTLVITTNILGLESSSTYTFVLDGDKLFLTSDGSTVEYTKQS